MLAVLLGSLAAVGFAGKLPRNRWLGIRTEATMRDDETFRVANLVAAPTQVGGAIALLLGGIASFKLDGVAGIIIVVVALLAALALLGLGASIGIRTAAAMPDDVGACGNSCGACSLSGSCDSSTHAH
ncbi:SdpI family protein [Tomitella biformata]|uniref:SdpI family protein n=1 Tax=Tomitella biformata TaxID=630403 RepID=UPI001F43FDF2|nr:SdpI family protein [Tomitella biformata]